MKRRRQRSSLERFVIASLALHVVLLVAVKFDAIRQTLRELPVFETIFAEAPPPEPAEQPLPEPDPAQQAAEQAKLEREAAARDEILAQLQADFEPLTAPLAAAELKQDLLEEMLERLAEPIAAQTARAADPAADPLATEAKLAELRQEFAAQLAPAIETLIAREAVKALQETFIPPLARHLEALVSQRVEQPFAHEARALQQQAVAAQQAAEFEKQLAAATRAELPRAAEEAFEKDFEEHGAAAQVQAALRIFIHRTNTANLRSETLRAEFARQAEAALKQAVPPATLPGERSVEAAQKLAPEPAPQAEPPPPDSWREQLTETFAKVVATGMEKLTVTTPHQAHQDFDRALGEAFGGSPALADLRKLGEHAQQQLRSGDLDVVSGEYPDEILGAPTPQHRDSRYEHAESLDTRAETVALVVETDPLAAAAAEPVAEETGGLGASRVLLPAVPALALAPPDAPYAPPFVTRRFAVAPCVAPDAITLDGDLSDWEGIPAYDLPGAQNGRPSVRFAWRPGGLYVAIAAADPDNVISKAGMGVYWQGDASDVWLDMPNRKAAVREPGDGTHQFAILPLGDHNPAVHGWEFGQHTGAGHSFVHELNERNFTRAFRKLDQAWNLELFFPASRLAEPRPALGRFIGADVSVANGRGIVYWAGGYASSWNAPGKWGDVLLSGSDAVVETRPVADPPGAWQATNTVFAAGRPLEIRVTDADMNRDPAVVERVRVVASAASGGRETVILAETGPDTGIFEGRLPTALGLGQPQPGLLDCQEGDIIRVVYFDRFWVAGPRSREVTGTAITALEIVASGQ